MAHVPLSKGAWTPQEDRKLAEVIELHGAKRWKSIAVKAGLNRSGKSCRLRWLNYLRPNIKRGNISDQEEDLILRLHKLLGNRWSLIAGRLPGRTDNEIKNYWNSHLSKKIKQKEKNYKAYSSSGGSSTGEDHQMNSKKQRVVEMEEEEEEEESTDDPHHDHHEDQRELIIREEGNHDDHDHDDHDDRDEDLSSKPKINMDVDDGFFDFSVEEAAGPFNLEWVSQFLELDHHHHHFHYY